MGGTSCIRMMLGENIDTPGPMFRLDHTAGTAQRWDAEQREWVPVDFFPLHRQLGLGEINFDLIPCPKPAYLLGFRRIIRMSGPLVPVPDILTERLP